MLQTTWGVKYTKRSRGMKNAIDNPETGLTHWTSWTLKNAKKNLATEIL